MIEIGSVRALDDAWKAATLVLFKHSSHCALSAHAYREVERFARQHPGIQVHLVNVIESRPVSVEVERQTGVRHESPQVLVVRNGVVVWHVSHWGVTAAMLAEHVASGDCNVSLVASTHRT